MNWEERPAKEKARKWLLDKIPHNTNGLTYLGLSAGGAIFEKMLCSERKVSGLKMFESDPDTCAQLVRTTMDQMGAGLFPKNSLVYWEDIDKHISYGVRSVPHGVVWLDYCGPISRQRLESLERSLRVRPRGGVVAVTFMACREPKTSTALIDDLVDNAGWDLEGVENVPAYFLRKIRAVSHFALEVDRGLKIEALPYKDGAPMMLIVFSDGGARSTIEIEQYIKE